MAGTKITQLAPWGGPMRRRRGAFGGKNPGPHPVGRITQLAPWGGPIRRRRGSFAGKTPTPVIIRVTNETFAVATIDAETFMAGG